MGEKVQRIHVWGTQRNAFGELPRSVRVCDLLRYEDRVLVEFKCRRGIYRMRWEDLKAAADRLESSPDEEMTIRRPFFLVKGPSAIPYQGLTKAGLR